MLGISFEKCPLKSFVQFSVGLLVSLVQRHSLCDLDISPLLCTCVLTNTRLVVPSFMVPFDQY